MNIRLWGKVWKMLCRVLGVGKVEGESDVEY